MSGCGREGRPEPIKEVAQRRTALDQSCGYGVRIRLDDGSQLSIAGAADDDANI